jgi:hypothetical protein
MMRGALVLAAMLSTSVPLPAVAIELTPSTITEWNRYVGRATSHLHECRSTCCHGAPDGRAIDIAGGTIHHWRGSTVVRHVTVDQVVNALMNPGTPPPQDDVLESRVLSRNGNALRIYLKLVRRTIISVVYDTEHDVVFERHSRTLATSRSISTKIAEEGGTDRGFLWRLNSYWRYSQMGSDVRIDLESISLSRDVPWFVRSMAEPLISRIARESVTRTLSSVRSYLEKSAPGAVDATSSCSTS